MSFPESNTIDALVDSILNNPDPSTLTPGDIDTLIAYHRAQRELGTKPARESAPKSAPTKADSVNLLKSIGAIGTTPTKTDSSFRRRF